MKTRRAIFLFGIVCLLLMGQIAMAQVYPPAPREPGPPSPPPEPTAPSVPSPQPAPQKTEYVSSALVLAALVVMVILGILMVARRVLRRRLSTSERVGQH